jgi:hypothetical protein
MDMNYSVLNPADVPLVNDDNDAAGIVVTAQPGLQTTEAGGQVTFTVMLRTQPQGGNTVIVPLTSSTVTEGVIVSPAPARLTFTAATWNIPQTVTVRGVQDAVADGPQNYTVLIGPATSGDVSYSGVVGADVHITNADDDVRGINLTVGPQPLTTTEAGGTASFSVVLNSQPQAAVNINMHTSNPAEGMFGPAGNAQPAIVVSFTADNWNIPQTITIVGQPDSIFDGDQRYTIVTDPSGSSDAAYNGINIADITMVNTDDEPMPAILVVPAAGCTAVNCNTTAGASASFTVRLSTQPLPMMAVSIPLSIDAPAEGSITAPATSIVTLDDVNWSTGVLVTVRGTDTINAAPVTYHLTGTAGPASDANYRGRTVSVTLVNNPPPALAGIVVTASTGCTADGTGAVSCDTSVGATASFRIALRTQPMADVGIDLTTTPAGHGSLNRTSVTLNSTNWQAGLAVTIMGLDLANAAPVTYSVVTGIATSMDPDYGGRDAANITCLNSAVVQPPQPEPLPEAGTDAQDN